MRAGRQNGRLLPQWRRLLAWPWLRAGLLLAPLLPLLAQGGANERNPWQSVMEAAQQAGKSTPRLTLAGVTEQERQLAGKGSKSAAARPALAGLHRRVPPKAVAKARRFLHPEGGWCWVLDLRSPQAKGMRVQFGEVRLGKGQLWVGDPSKPDEKFGPYSGAGPMGDGEFWSDTVLADTVRVLYVSRTTAGPAKLPPFQILQISHLLDAPF